MEKKYRFRSEKSPAEIKACMPSLIVWLLCKRGKTREEYLDLFMRDYLQCEKEAVDEN